MARPTRVALVLGSGGARGYAHIGVIQVLEQRGYEIVAIAGTSMGALVGGLHAAGGLDAYTRWARSLTKNDVWRLLDPALRAPGAIRATKIFTKVTELLGDTRIEDMPIPYTAVATDLLTAKEVWFQSGPLISAIRASIALPGFITPVTLNGRLLADGGLTNPIPVAATAAADADITIAVSLAEEHLLGQRNAAVRESSESDTSRAGADLQRRDIEPARDTETLRSIVGWFNGARGTASASDSEAHTPPDDGADLPSQRSGLSASPTALGPLEVMQLSLEALQGAVTRFRLAGSPPDLLVTIPRGSAHTLDFHRASEMIALGRERTIVALDRVDSRS
jgi:NTE family protein